MFTGFVRLVEMNLDQIRNQEDTEAAKPERFIRKSDGSERPVVTTIYKGSLDLKRPSTDFFKGKSLNKEAR